MNSLFINETALHTRLLRPPSPSLLQAGSRVEGLGSGGGVAAFCRLPGGVRL